MTEIATIDWFGRWGTSVFSENTAIFHFKVCYLYKKIFSTASYLQINSSCIHIE